MENISSLAPQHAELGAHEGACTCTCCAFLLPGIYMYKVYRRWLLILRQKLCDGTPEQQRLPGNFNGEPIKLSRFYIIMWHT